MLFIISEQKKEDYAPNTFNIRQNSTPVVSGQFDIQSQRLTLTVQVPFQSEQYQVISFSNDSLVYSNSNNFGTGDLKEYHENSFLCVENQTWQNFTYWQISINSGNYLTYRATFPVDNQYINSSQVNDSSFLVSTRLYVIDFDLREGKRRRTYQFPINLYSNSYLEIQTNVSLQYVDYFVPQFYYELDSSNRTMLVATVPYQIQIDKAYINDSTQLSFSQQTIEEQCYLYEPPIVYGYEDVIQQSEKWVIEGQTYECTEEYEAVNVQIIYNFQSSYIQEQQQELTNNMMFNITRINGTYFQVTNLSSNVYGYTCDGNDKFYLIYNNGFIRENNRCDDLRLYTAIIQDNQIIQKQVYRFNMDFYFYTYDKDYLTPGTTCDYSRQQYEKYKGNK